MLTWLVLMADGSQRTIEAERWEDVAGDATFYDDNGDQVVTLARGQWQEVKPQ